MSGLLDIFDSAYKSEPSLVDLDAIYGEPVPQVPSKQLDSWLKTDSKADLNQEAQADDEHLKLLSPIQKSRIQELDAMQILLEEDIHVLNPDKDTQPPSQQGSWDKSTLDELSSIQDIEGKPEKTLLVEQEKQLESQPRQLTEIVVRSTPRSPGNGPFYRGSGDMYAPGSTRDEWASRWSFVMSTTTPKAYEMFDIFLANGELVRMKILPPDYSLDTDKTEIQHQVLLSTNVVENPVEINHPIHEDRDKKLIETPMQTHLSGDISAQNRMRGSLKLGFLRVNSMTCEQKQQVDDSNLSNKGDMILAWVSQGDLSTLAFSGLVSIEEESNQSLDKILSRKDYKTTELNDASDKNSPALDNPLANKNSTDNPRDSGLPYTDTESELKELSAVRVVE